MHRSAPSSRFSLVAARERKSDQYEDRTEHQEADLPPYRRAEVVADVMDAENLVVYDAFHEVEDAPARKQHAGVSAPRRRDAAAAHSGFEEPVTFAVACGGDTDTIGAMAGAIAGARDGITAIPARWLDALENGDRGRSYVEDLARRLWERRAMS